VDRACTRRVPASSVRGSDGASGRSRHPPSWPRPGPALPAPPSRPRSDWIGAPAASSRRLESQFLAIDAGCCVLSSPTRCGGSSPARRRLPDGPLWGTSLRSVPDGATAPRVATHPLFAPTPATSARTGWSSSTPTQTFWSSGLSTRLPGARASDLEVAPSCEQPARIGPQAAQCEGAAWIQALNPGRCVGLWRRDRYRLPLGLPRGAGGILQESVEQQSSGLE